MVTSTCTAKPPECSAHTATRPRACRLRQSTLPLAPGRADSARSIPSGSVRRTATRPWACRFGTFTVEWQCEAHCHSGLNASAASVDTATRPRAHRFGTFDTEWQCEAHCHSGLNASAASVDTATRPWACQMRQSTLPLASGRTDSVRSPSSGSVRRTATRA